jgi:hypothetical protein
MFPSRFVGAIVSENDKSTHAGLTMAGGIGDARSLAEWPRPGRRTPSLGLAFPVAMNLINCTRPW